MSTTVARKFRKMEEDCAKLVNYYNSNRNYTMAQQTQSLLTTLGGFNTQLETREETETLFPE